VGDEVGSEVPPVAEVAVLLPAVEKVVPLPQDNGEGSDDGEGSDSNDNDDNSKDKAMRVPFRMAPSGIMCTSVPFVSGSTMIPRSR
jgi:hypothetical protein